MSLGAGWHLTRGSAFLGWASHLAVLGACACATPSPEAARFQGVVELEEIALGFEFGGRLELVAVARGDKVSKGQALAALDPTLEASNLRARQAELAAAEAQLRLLRAGTRGEELAAAAAQVRAAEASERRLEHSLARERQLSALGLSPSTVADDLEDQLQRASAERQSLEQTLAALSKGARPEQLQSARAQADAVAAAVELLQERLERYVLRAPLDGSLLDVHFESGETVAAGVSVATLADLDRPWVEVFVPQAEMALVRLGAQAQVFVDAWPHAFRGEVEHIARQTEFTPRFVFSTRERANLVLRVRVRIQDPEHQLFAGLPAFVSWGPEPP